MASSNDIHIGVPDPTRALSSLDSSSPITLLPVRVETRFTTESDNAKQPQLWVRIYPDDCWVDTFEATLSKDELANAKVFWAAYWRAGGVEGDERAAWRSLVAAHGSGRANYILDQFAPQNPPPPVKAGPTDVILVICASGALDSADADALKTYWRSVWLADGDQALTTAAYTALQTAVGANVDQLVADFKPFNMADSPTAPLTRSDVAVSTAFVVFPADPPVQDSSWSRAPRITHFPDYFAVIAFNAGTKVLQAVGSQVSLPLYVGPDPSASEVDTLHVDPVTGDLVVPPNLAWMVDFPAAVAAGVGIRVNLTAEQARTGFDRLIVVGLQLSATAQDGKNALTEILNHHATGGSGLEVLRQGTPTHNTTGNSSGYTRRDDTDESFDDRNAAPLFAVTSDVMQMRDGQVLADALGIDPSTFFRIHGSDATDQVEARAMQTALWPATAGYWMDKLMTPVFSDDTIASAHWYFTNYVRGRGVAPAIRIGGQPYGILPTTAFSRIGWISDPTRGAAGTLGDNTNFLAGLKVLLARLDADWERMSAAVSYVGKAGDPHQLLLDIVGLHPDSVEYYSRYAETLPALWNLINLTGRAPSLWQNLQQLQNAGMQLLQSLGYTGGQRPPLLDQFFIKTATLIGTVIDDRASSESTPVRSYTDDGKNYIQWLSDAAKTSLDALQQEQGFSGNQTPQALLYLLLRHALMLGYNDVSYGLYRSAGFPTAEQLAAFKPEPAFVHVDAAAVPSESRFAKLYTAEPRITSSPNQLVSDYITANYATLPESATLAGQIAALALLQDLPTSALERLLAEHVDTCSYRLDSWMLGLAALRLETMRLPARQEKGLGTYLGAYAWLEDVRPVTSLSQPVNIPPAVAANFPGPTPITSDPSNGGYIAAPSLSQAKTAAVLRSGYLDNARNSNPQTLGIDLSSDRVRLALSLLDGIRSGQSLGALLGYRFERGLHDDHGLAEVDKFIYPLRRAFPLVADGIAATQATADVPIEALEARNVLDGRKLLTQIQSSGQATYPFGWTATPLPAASTLEAEAINQEASRLLDAFDAVADLALAEGVHQAVQGNFDRLAGTLETYSTGNFPPDPEVIRTPSTGVSVTHRVAVHFNPSPGTPGYTTPRSIAEPGLDEWLEQVLPPLDKIQCTVDWTDPLTNGARTRMVSLRDLMLRPVDVVALVRADDSPAMTELDDRVMSFVLATDHPRPDAAPVISYLAAPSNAISVFAASALIRQLRALLVRARPLVATDVLLQANVNQDSSAISTIDRARIAGPMATYAALSTDLASFVAALAPLVQDPVANRAALLSQVDTLLSNSAGLLERCARFNVPQSGWGFLADWKRTAFSDLIAAVVTVVTRWDAKLDDFGAKQAAYNALPAATTDADRFQALRIMESIVSTSLIVPLPAAPVDFLTQVLGKQQSFTIRRDNLNATTGTTNNAFSALLAAVNACLPIDAFDNQTLEITPFEDRVVTVCSDLYRTISGQASAVASRYADASSALQEHDNTADPDLRKTALQSAAKAIFGADFTLYAQFMPASAHAGEWASAYGTGSDGTLLSYLTNTEKIDFPVDEWLTGVARVRPALRVWEAVTNVAAALNSVDLPLTPAQFPFEATAPWVALQYGPDYAVTAEHLLYTAQYLAGGFDKTQPQCGMLLDEWSEVIPSDQRTAGIAFNFDRPNSEPPQSILIVTPASVSEGWQWDDLLGALNETLDLAKKRAVEPVNLDPTTIARFLPATIAATTTYAITISATLAATNGVFRQMEARP